MEMSLVYITAGGREEALQIGRALVEDRMVACANVLDGMYSLYWWEGAVQQDSEAVLIVKTRRALVPRVIERVRALHSYDCPCVVALPIVDGNPDYLAWLAAETEGPPAGKVAKHG